MKTINKLRDKKTGRFQTTTNTSRYKAVQFNGKRMSEHSREMCIVLNIPKIPKGFIIHHLDENKRNNDIHNLALMSITAHNRIHSHEAWNKGMNKGDNDKWDNALYKIRQSREKYYNKLFKEAHDLKESGKSSKEIAEIQGIKVLTARFRIRRHKELKNKYGKQ